MATGEIKIKVDASDLIAYTKVECIEIECRHNLGHVKGMALCGLKQIYILKEGKCEQYEACERIPDTKTFVPVNISTNMKTKQEGK